MNEVNRIGSNLKGTVLLQAKKRRGLESERLTTQGPVKSKRFLIL